MSKKLPQTDLKAFLERFNARTRSVAFENLQQQAATPLSTSPTMTPLLRRSQSFSGFDLPSQELQQYALTTSEVVPLLRGEATDRLDNLRHDVERNLPDKYCTHSQETSQEIEQPSSGQQTSKQQQQQQPIGNLTRRRSWSVSDGPEYIRRLEGYLADQASATAETDEATESTELEEAEDTFVLNPLAPSFTPRTTSDNGNASHLNPLAPTFTPHAAFFSQFEEVNEELNVWHVEIDQGLYNHDVFRSLQSVDRNNKHQTPQISIESSPKSDTSSELSSRISQLRESGKSLEICPVCFTVGHERGDCEKIKHKRSLLNLLRPVGSPPLTEKQEENLQKNIFQPRKLSKHSGLGISLPASDPFSEPEHSLTPSSFYSSPPPQSPIDMSSSPSSYPNWIPAHLPSEHPELHFADQEYCFLRSIGCGEQEAHRLVRARVLQLLDRLNMMENMYGVGFEEVVTSLDTGFWFLLSSSCRKGLSFIAQNEF